MPMTDLVELVVQLKTFFLLYSRGFLLRCICKTIHCSRLGNFLEISNIQNIFDNLSCGYRPPCDARLPALHQLGLHLVHVQLLGCGDLVQVFIPFNKTQLRRFPKTIFQSDESQRIIIFKTNTRVKNVQLGEFIFDNIA